MKPGPMNTQPRTDDATNRRLWRLVGPVVVGGSLIALWGLWSLSATPMPAGLIGMAALTLVLVGNGFTTIQVRIRSTSDKFTPTTAVITLAAVFLPAPEMILGTVCGELLYNLARRITDPMKIGFNVGKDTIGAAAAVFAASAVGIRPILLNPDYDLPNAIKSAFVAFIAYTVVDEVVSQALFSILTHTPFRQRLLAQGDVGLITRVGLFAVAVIALAAYQVSEWLLLVLPPLVYAVHLAAANKIRTRLGDEAWQRLAEATDEFNSVDQTAVLYAAVRRATDLFSTYEAEVEIHSRLVRSDGKAILFDGAPLDAPTAEGFVITVALESYRGDADLGELRLRFRGERAVKFTEREQYTLRTFTAALCTAIRNAATLTIKTTTKKKKEIRIKKNKIILLNNRN